MWKGDKYMEDLKLSFFKKIRKYIIYTYILLIVDIYFLNKGIKILPSISWFIVCFFSIFQIPEIIFIELMLIAPISHAFQLYNGITTFPIMSSILVLKLLFRNRSFDKKFILLYIVLFAFNISSTLIQYGTMMYTIPFFLYFLMVYLAKKSLKFSEYLYEMSLKCFIVSVVIVCVGSKLLPVAADFLNNSTEFTVRNCGFSNVWDFGQNISISMSIILIALKRKRIKKTMGMILLCFLSFFLIETGLYTALIGITVTIFFYPFISEKRQKNRNKNFILSFLLIFLFLLIGYFIIFPRMFALRSQISNNGRFDLWLQYIDIFFKTPRITLFGIGADSISAFAAINGIRSTHNVIIEKLIEFGIIGVVFLVIEIFNIFKGISMLPTKNHKSMYIFSYLSMGMFQGISGAETIFLFLILACWQKKSNKFYEVKNNV